MILPGDVPASVAMATERICAGELVGLPTETVYGLAADACNDKAVAKIFTAKGRPYQHPLIVHVVSAQAANYFAAEVPPFARALMQTFWPGPLTLILPRRPLVATACASAQASIGVRCPSHPIAQMLLTSCAARGVHGLAAPSANQFGRVSPTTALHVQSEFANDELLILDGGACSGGIESTIIDCTRGAPVLLRPGVLTSMQLEAACGQTILANHAMRQDAPLSSGSLASHYAPRAKVLLLNVPALQDKLQDLEVQGAYIAVWSRTSITSFLQRTQFRTMPSSSETAAYELFATLRAFDALGVDFILIEKPPEDCEWAGVLDRLRRAAA